MSASTNPTYFKMELILKFIEFLFRDFPKSECISDTAVYDIFQIFFSFFIRSRVNLFSFDSFSLKKKYLKIFPFEILKCFFVQNF